MVFWHCDTDTVDTVINIMQKLGFSTDMSSWIKSYLTKWTQFVWFDSVLFGSLILNKGASQGSILGTFSSFHM